MSLSPSMAIDEKPGVGRSEQTEGKYIMKYKPENKKKPTPTEIYDSRIKTVNRREKQAKLDVSFAELVTVIADSLERLGFFFNRPNSRLNCEEEARIISRYMLYGVDHNGYLLSSIPSISVREDDYETIPLCKEHR